MNKAIGFIGLGIMGYPMAGHLSKKGLEVSVFNRSKEKSLKWTKEYKGTLSTSLIELADSSKIIISCVGNDEDLKNIFFSKGGMFDNLKPGTIVIDHTTTSSDTSKMLNEKLNSKQVIFLDAPVSGGQAGAESGQLSIMVGGQKEGYEKVKGILEKYSKFTKYMGASGSGQLTKMVNQICIAGLLQALAEGLNFSKKVGLDSKSVIEVISKGAAQSWQMENRWQTMIEDKYDHGFAVDLMRKDLEIVLKRAKTSNINLDVTKIVNNFYKDIQNAGGGKWDTSSLLKRIEELT
tara:strand:+ start:13028 stop:13903 length:876 start_codon:yes stop_codon:yes gene_type:complete